MYKARPHLQDPPSGQGHCTRGRGQRIHPSVSLNSPVALLSPLNFQFLFHREGHRSHPLVNAT